MAALLGSSFCIAGVLSIVSRSQMEESLRENGAIVTTKVTDQTTHLICNESNESSKLQKAKALGVSIVSEETALAMMGISGAPSFEKDVSVLDVDVNTTTTSTPHDSEIVDSTSILKSDDVPNDIPDGESVQVKKYVLKHISGVYSCSCPSWRFQSKPIDKRTCKHLKEYRGEAVEQQRIGETASPKKRKVAPTTTTPNKKAAPIQSGGLFEAENLMLAHSYKPETTLVYSDYLISEKLDGMRALWDGTQLVSRAGNRIHAPDFFTAGLPSHMALDGELFAGRGQFQQTVSIARRQAGGEIWRTLKFVVFDAPTVAGGFEDRLAAVWEIKSDFLVVHPHETCRDQTHLEEELQRIESLGGEGLMLRKKQSEYRNGRSHDLLKVKTFHDDEAIVCGHQDGKGKHSGRMGALLCRLKNRTEFKVGSGFSDAQRANPPPVGSIITFRYFETTTAGVPRFPTFVRVRPDVDAAQFAP